jgi:hypothetical protein
MSETRHGDPASPIDFRALTPSQREILSGRHATHLKGERLSPDLACVVVDISRDRSRRRKRERARALLLTLDREWKDLYEGHESATAVYSDRTWVPTATIPASWRAGAMDTPWLSNEAGLPTPPRQLAVRTPLTEALYGRDAATFASDVVEGLASSPAVRALGLTADPSVEELVGELTQLSAGPDEVDHAAVAVRYVAIARAVTTVDAGPDSMVGNLTVRQLRARFGNDRRKPGLILVDGEWLPPMKVMRGRPIFGSRRAFVPEGKSADRLWRVLGIRPPTVSDCVSVLNELAASGAPTQDDEQVLADTYVYLSDRVTQASRSEQRAIAGLPLWSGERWLTQRPIFAVDDPVVAHALSKKLPVWEAPVSRRALGQLLAALGVTVLDDGDFTPVLTERDLVAGQFASETFAAAVDHLGNWLASRDPRLHRALEPAWDGLADADIALGAGFELELRLDGKRLRVPARAHLVRSPLELCFASEGDIGDKEAGGRVIAALFSDGDPDKIALAWADAWLKASHGERAARMRPAEARDDHSMDELFKQAAETRKSTQAARRGEIKPIPAGDGRAAEPTAIDTVRRLKSPEDLIVSSVTRPDGTEVGGGQQGGRRGLKEEPSAGKPIGKARRPAPLSAVQAYAPQEQEHLALEALNRAVNGELSDLRDFRHLQGGGIDAFDRLKRAFEIKSFARVMPNKVTLTTNQYERAIRDGNKYYLAVVAGLEEGFDTVVRIIGNPAATLKLQDSANIVLTGVLSAKKPIEVRFSRSDEPQVAT